MTKIEKTSCFRSANIWRFESFASMDIFDDFTGLGVYCRTLWGYDFSSDISLAKYGSLGAENNCARQT